MTVQDILITDEIMLPRLLWRRSYINSTTIIYLPFKVIIIYALTLAGVSTMLLSFTIISKSVSIKSNTKETFDFCPNTSANKNRKFTTYTSSAR